MNRRVFIKIASGIAFLFSSSLSLVYACIRRFYPEESGGQEGATGVSLRDIKIDKYGRTLVKGRGGQDDNTHLAADYPPDRWCPPEDPSKCTLKQCGCGTNQQCNCPSPHPDSQCNCPPPTDSQCNCPSPNNICNCPDLVCPCPPPPPPPPVPDLVCPCPTPPKPPF